MKDCVFGIMNKVNYREILDKIDLKQQNDLTEFLR
jgi:hypothetical protein